MTARRAPTEAEWAFVRAARVGRLATVAADGSPRVVPICFAALDDPEPVIVSVLDEKPKRVGDNDLARMRNIRANPAVAIVIDHYDEDWSALRFVQIRGVAGVLAAGGAGHDRAIAALRAKYPQYRAMAIDHRPVIAIGALNATSWRGDGEPFA